MLLLVGGTGLLGSKVAERLAQRGIPFRALVRPGTASARLEGLGAQIVRGDMRASPSLIAAMDGVDTVISTANAMARVLGGGTDLSIRDVDEEGNANLVRAAEAAGVQRFVFISFLEQILARTTPFGDAKRATERRLQDADLREVIVRPDMYQEVWLTPLVQFDWPNRSVTIFGKGDARHAYLAVDDVADAVVHWSQADDAPRLVEIGGPERLTRNEAADAFERALGEPIKRRHVPRPALRVGSTLLRRIRPAVASVMGQALAADIADSTADDRPLREIGLTPRPASRYIEEVVRQASPSSRA
jgi:NADH dehydrogenase